MMIQLFHKISALYLNLSSIAAVPIENTSSQIESPQHIHVCYCGFNKKKRVPCCV